ncbi:MAG: alpha-L-fucosidase [Clostridiales bacterium]|nr:alpha-L-fucosidase [Clostridiales bacterium]
MNRAQALYEIEKVIERGPYRATMASLGAYRVPDWYADGKFGIFIHWGPYCVPAFGNEWYPRNMYQPDTKEFAHHAATYGPHKSFGYKDFIPLFKAERFDPDDWARLFQDAGARFVVPVAEHHDGFQMYRSDVCRWNAFEMGPKRDICGELARSVRDQGMVFGASSHRAEHYWFMNGVHMIDSDYTPELEDFYGPAAPISRGPDEYSRNFPTAEHMNDWLVRTCEIVDRFRPQLIWFDWWINNYAFRPYLEKFAAYYYNRGVEWGLGVAINYKYHAYDEGCAVFDVERGQLSDNREMLWQNDTSISKNSWGYIEGHDYKKPIDILCDLVDIVSKNGALLLNIGPKADGTIPQPEREILLSIGGWLKKNGEAIYGTRPWRLFGEGPTQVPEGAFTDTNRDAFTGRDIRYTAKDGALYAVALGRPEGGELLLTRVAAEDGFTAAHSMDGQPLSIEQTAEGLRVKLPAGLADEPLPLALRLSR